MTDQSQASTINQSGPIGPIGPSLRTDKAFTSQTNQLNTITFSSERPGNHPIQIWPLSSCQIGREFYSFPVESQHGIEQVNICPVIFGITLAAFNGVAGGSQPSDRLGVAHSRMIEGSSAALSFLVDPFNTPSFTRVVNEQPKEKFRRGAEWSQNGFCMGEQPSENNLMPTVMSTLDQNLQVNFVSYDQPDRHDGYLPTGFLPVFNPLGIPLPHKGIAKVGVHRPEGSAFILSFWKSYQGDGILACKGRWVAVQYANKVCFAQLEGVGPFVSDHWQSLFGSVSPRTDRTQPVGTALSPAARDFPDLRSGETAEWRFTTDQEVPRGPWKSWSIQSSPPHP